MLKRLNFPLLASVAMLVSVPYLMSNAADEAKPAAAPAAPAAAEVMVDLSTISDPAFDRYVDLVLLGSAWDAMDAGLMTDCALQLAEGERILMRNHKAINSKQVLALAVKVAAEKRDTAALDRLASVCESTKNTAVSDQIASAKKLAGQSRKVDPAVNVSAIDTSPTQLAIYQEAINGAKAATISGDATYFKNLEAGLNDKESMLASLTESQRAHLKKIMGESRELMPKEASPQLTDTLEKLKGVSRGNFGFGVNSIVQGINSIQSGHKGHGVGSIINGIGHIATSGHGHGHGHISYYPPSRYPSGGGYPSNWGGGGYPGHGYPGQVYPGQVYPRPSYPSYPRYNPYNPYAGGGTHGWNW